MNKITQILNTIKNGDPNSAEQLLPLVYDELRKLAALKLAQELPGQTLQATALVHEAYIRLMASEESSAAAGRCWDSRRHFLAAAAEAMRRILIDRARDKHRLKRGGGWRRLKLDDHFDFPIHDPPAEVLALDEALQKLAQENPRCANLVKFRYFAGMTLAEAACALGIAPRSADRYWAFARAWLYDELCQGDETAEG